MKISYFIGFLVAFFALLSEVLSDKKWWKITTYLVTLLLTSPPVFSGLHEFFFSNKSKTKRLRLALYQYIYSDYSEEVLHNMYWSGNGIYCNPFQQLSRPCGHRQILIKCSGDDPNFGSFNDSNKPLGLIFYTKDLDNISDSILRCDGAVVADINTNAGFKSWSDMHQDTMIRHLGCIKKVLFFKTIEGVTFSLRFSPKSSVLHVECRSDKCSNYGTYRGSCTYANFIYICTLLRHISDWNKSCCFVSDFRYRKVSKRDNSVDVHHCITPNELFEHICSGGRVKYQSLSKSYKCFEGMSGHELCIYKYGEDFFKYLHKFLKLRYDDKASCIINALGKYDTSRGLKGELSFMGNWQYKRLLSDVSYLQEYNDSFSISGVDFSVPPTKIVKSYARRHPKVLSRLRYRYINEHNYNSLNPPKGERLLDAVKGTVMQKILKKASISDETKNSDLRIHYIAEGIDTKKGLKFIKRSKFMLENNPLKHQKLTFQEKINHKLNNIEQPKVYPKGVEGFKLKKADTLSDLEAYKEAVDSQIKYLDSIFTKATFSRQFLKVLSFKIELLGLNIDKYVNIRNALVDIAKLNVKKDVIYNPKVREVYEKNLNAKLRSKNRMLSLTGSENISVNINLQKEMLNIMRSLQAYLRNLHIVDDHVFKKKEKFGKFLEKKADILKSKVEMMDSAPNKNTDNVNMPPNDKKGSDLPENRVEPNINEELNIPVLFKDEEINLVGPCPSTIDDSRDIPVWEFHTKRNEYMTHRQTIVKSSDYLSFKKAENEVRVKIDQAADLPDKERKLALSKLFTTKLPLNRVYSKIKTLTDIAPQIDDYPSDLEIDDY